MRFQRTLTVLSFALMLLAQTTTAAAPCVVHVGPAAGAAADPAAAGYAAAVAQSGACVTRVAQSDAAAAVAAAGDVVVTGVVGEAAVAAIRAAAPSAVIVAPQTASAAARGYDSRVYFTSTDPVSEVVASLAHVQPRSVAVMQVAGAGMEAVATAASEAAGSDAAVYNAASADAADVDEAQYAAVIAAAPDAIVVAGPSGAQASAFVRRAVQDPRVIASGASIVAPAAMQASVLAAYAQAVASGAAVVPASRVVFSTTNPVANDARYQAVADFKADMGTAAAQYNTAEQTAAMAGWIAGKVAQQIVARYGSTGSAVEAGMTGQNRFLVSDLVVGDYAGACPAGVHGIACSCNQGGRTIYISTASIAADGTVDIAAVPSATYSYPLSTCVASPSQSQNVLHDAAAAAESAASSKTTTEAPKKYKKGSYCKPSHALIILLICICFIMICVPLLGYLAWALWKTFSGRSSSKA